MFGTAACTDFVDCVHGAGLVHSQNAHQPIGPVCVCFCVYAHHTAFVREVPKICERDFTFIVETYSNHAHFTKQLPLKLSLNSNPCDDYEKHLMSTTRKDYIQIPLTSYVNLIQLSITEATLSSCEGTLMLLCNYSYRSFHSKGEKQYEHWSCLEVYFEVITFKSILSNKYKFFVLFVCFLQVVVKKCGIQII